MITKISLHLSAPDLGDEQIVDNPRPKDGETSPQGLPQLPQVEGDCKALQGYILTHTHLTT